MLRELVLSGVLGAGVVYDSFIVVLTGIGIFGGISLVLYLRLKRSTPSFRNSVVKLGVNIQFTVVWFAGLVQ